MATTNEGLIVEGQLSLDNARTLNVYEGMLRDTINEFSIGYIVLAEHKESSPQYGTYSALTEVSLSEISVVYAGANRFTRLLDIKSNTTSSNTTSTVTRTAEPWRADLEDWNRRIDEAAGPSRRKVSADEVDAFIREVREERVRAKLAEAEQAAWEERMRISLVLAAVPVRVDALMRPDR
jgi:Caudovirus prohead serine protease